MNDKEDTMNQLIQQHFNNYKNAIIELIKNNTNVLFDEDISLLVKRPPLDSMDSIKSKILDLAKKKKVILADDYLNKFNDSFRNDLYKEILKNKKLRIDKLVKIVSGFSPKKNIDIIKINKKDFNDMNTKFKRVVKTDILELIDKKYVKNVNKIFTKNTDKEIANSLAVDFIKYLKGAYLKQLLENIDFKILVKDTTLINLIKEQGERFLFTKNNSYLFKEK